MPPPIRDSDQIFLLPSSYKPLWICPSAPTSVRRYSTARDLSVVGTGPSHYFRWSTGLLNFAQGEMATFTAYIAFVLLAGPQPRLTGGGLAGLVPGVPFTVPLAIVGAVLCGMAVGAATERVLIRPLGGASDLALVNITIGLLLATNSLMAQWWGTAPESFQRSFQAEQDSISPFLEPGLRYSTIGVWIVLFVLILLILLLRHTAGLAFRAVSISPSNAELVGVRVGLTLMYGWAMASGFGALQRA